MRQPTRASTIFIRLGVAAARPRLAAGALLAILCGTASVARAQVQVPVVPVSCDRVCGVEVDPPVVAGAVELAPTTTVTELREWQVAYFRRAGGAMVVTAFDVSRDKVFWQFLAGWGTVPLGGPQPEPWNAAVFAPWAVPAEDGTRAPATTIVEGSPRAKWIASIPAAWDSLALALDLVAPADPAAPIPIVRSGAVGRARMTAQPPLQATQRVQMSDILLYEPEDRQEPRALEGAQGAMARALGTTVLGGRMRVGLYWETYGLEDGENAKVELVALPVAEPGKEDTRTPTGLSWSVVASGAEGMPHGLVLDVRTLRAGRYDLVATVSAPGQESVSVARRITVEIDSGW